MKKIYLLILLLGTMLGATAQTFSVYPSNTVNHDVDPRGFVDAYIKFPNSFQNPLTLIWEETNRSYPSGWIMTICDNAACYQIPHAIDTMNTVMASDSGFLKVTCIPNEILGSGTISYHVYDMNSPTSQANVTFNFNVTNATATVDVQFGDRFTLSPNPASDHVSLIALQGQLDKGLVQVYGLNGKLVASTAVNRGLRAEVDLSALESGLYLLRYTSATGTMTKKVLVAH